MKKIIILSAVVLAAFTATKADYLNWQVTSLGDNYQVQSSTLYNNASGYYQQIGATQSGSTGSVEFTLTNPNTYDNDNYYIEVVAYNSSTEDYELLHAGSFTYAKLHSTQSLTSAMSEATRAMWANVQYTSGAVPEPTSGLMMLVGMALLGLKRRRA